MDQKQVSRLSCRGISTAALLGFVAVAAARLLTLPRSVWELDETLFMSGVLDFEPLRHHPHPPGYPLLIGLGKLFAPGPGCAACVRCAAIRARRAFRCWSASASSARSS